MFLNKILAQVPRCTKVPLQISKAFVSIRTLGKPAPKNEENEKYPRKIFSGIQPTGKLHIGNYLGAVQKWTELQNSREDVFYCIVDMHSITVPQNPALLRENIFKMAASMLACGINPDRSTIFVQSLVPEHAELAWILSCFCTMARLGHLPQYKEKSRVVKDVPLGIYVYPVLQAADIMLYKATHVPVGDDQVQHIQLTQHLARTFNARFGSTFPICQAMIDDPDAARIRSLRNPSKKMSKSDPDSRGTINICDNPDIIVDKIKKAVTDFTSDVSYEPTNRPGVSNLVVIHAKITDTPIDKIVEEAKTVDTARYKQRVADAVVEHLKPIRHNIMDHLMRKSDLIHLLEVGSEKARLIAQQNIEDIKKKMGLGTFANIPQSIDVTVDHQETSSIKEPKKEEKIVIQQDSDVPVVPKQKIRQERRRIGAALYKPPATFKLDDEASVHSVPIIKKAQ